MSREIDDIADQMRQVSAQHGPAAILPAEVLAVNEDDTVQIEFSGGAVIDDARLKSVVKEGNKMLLVPKVGSIVLVGKIENSDEYLVIGFDEITQVKTLIDTVEFGITEQGFLIKKGSDSLQGLMEDLFAAIGRMVFTTNTGPTIELVNALEFTELKTRFDTLLKNN